MKRVNSIVICKDDYNSKEDFVNAIKDAIMVLLNNNYIMTVRYDEKALGIVVIDYNHDDQAFGDTYPYWLLPDEIESIALNKED